MAEEYKNGRENLDRHGRPQSPNVSEDVLEGMQNANNQPYERLRSDLEDTLESLDEQNPPLEEWHEAKKREEIEKIERRGFVQALRQRFQSGTTERMPDEGKEERDETYKEVFVKLGLSTLLIMMILGVALLRNQPNDTVRQASVPPANTILTTAQDNTTGNNPQASLMPQPEAPVGPVEDVIDEAPLDEEEVSQAEIDEVNQKRQQEQTLKDEVLAVGGTAANQTLLTMPAKGSISRNFGYGFDKTWQDYRFHGGIDVDMEVGGKVVAALDGTVEEITKDKGKGTIVKIKHSEDMYTCYMGMEPVAGLQKGAAVAAGDEIGTVTESPLFEADEKTHLHFEVSCNGKLVDPTTMFAE